jgi:hypothetical protein
VPFVLHSARHLAPVHGRQVIGADGVDVGGSGSDGLGVSGDLRLLLAPDTDHDHEQGQQAQLKEMPCGSPLFAIQFVLF